MRVRGLKLFGHGIPEIPEDVAPHAGAWIETVLLFNHHRHQKVAPHAGAWIETKK